MTIWEKHDPFRLKLLLKISVCLICIVLYLQVAFDEMQNKVKELNNVITQNPPDMKKLQLVLQGSVSVQVCESLQHIFHS